MPKNPGGRIIRTLFGVMLMLAVTVACLCAAPVAMNLWLRWWNALPH